MMAKFQTLSFIAVASIGLVGCSAIENESVDVAETEIKAASQVDNQAIEKINTLFSMSPAAQQAKEAAISQCLSDQGLTWQPGQLNQPFDIRSQFSPKALSIEDAQQYGYLSQEPNTEVQAPLVDDTALEAYRGNPENGSVVVEGIPGAIAADGCLAQSYKAVFGSAEAGVLFESGIQNLPLPYIGAAQIDSKQEELNQRWSACMKDHYGIEIQTPDLASVDTSMDSHQLAMYDAQCRQEVNYEEVTTEILNAYLTTFLTDNEGIIDQLTQAKQTAEKNAPEILGK
ncbi:hypothetical protein [Rothia nasimurium]|nr:hypothetical protein [Rothia nasimurium]